MRFFTKLIGVALLACGPLAILAHFHPPDGSEGADWIQFLGRFHVLLVHLPICLIALVPLLEVAGRRGHWAFLHHAAGFVLVLAGLATLAAVVLGGLLAYGGGYSGASVDRHMLAGLILAATCGLALLLRPWAMPAAAPWPRPAYFTVLFAGVGLMIWTSHEGGSLTHGDSYLTERIPDRFKKMLGIKEKPSHVSAGVPSDSLYFQRIQPIFDDHCVTCHSPEKTKGGLRMETYAALMKGGKEGPVVTALDLAKSELYRRITLPSDDKKFMPSEGKKPLSKVEVLVIKQWIASGASPTKTPIEVAAMGFAIPAAERPAVIIPLAPDYRPFAAKIGALESKLGIRLVPVSETPTDGLILRTVSEPQKMDDAVLVQLAPIAPLVVDAELARTRVTDKGLGALEKFSNLRRLDLAHTAVTSGNLRAFSFLHHLEWLNLVGTDVDDGGAATLHTLPGLKEIYLFGSKVSVPASPAPEAPALLPPPKKNPAKVVPPPAAAAGAAPTVDRRDGSGLPLARMVAFAHPSDLSRFFLP